MESCTIYYHVQSFFFIQEQCTIPYRIIKEFRNILEQNCVMSDMIYCQVFTLLVVDNVFPQYSGYNYLHINSKMLKLTQMPMLRFDINII